MVEEISTNVQNPVGIVQEDIDRAKKPSFPSASVPYKEGLLFAAQLRFVPLIFLRSRANLTSL